MVKAVFPGLNPAIPACWLGMPQAAEATWAGPVSELVPGVPPFHAPASVGVADPLTRSLIAAFMLRQVKSPLRPALPVA